MKEWTITIHKPNKVCPHRYTRWNPPRNGYWCAFVEGRHGDPQKCSPVICPFADTGKAAEGS